MPLGAIIAGAHLMDWPAGSHASTFGGNPVSCAAALETIALLEEGLIENAADTGRLLRERLEKLKDRHELIGDVRGMGLMVGVELVRNRATKERAVEARDRVIQACFRRGLLLLGCGECTVRFCPPLVVGPEEVETALSIFDEALTEVVSSERGAGTADRLGTP
jgi:4-aminobutyrate aminotransferase